MTTSAGGETYTLPEIQSFYAEEYPTLHGTSPAVYAQNQELVERITAAAAHADDSILSVQLLGSRASGAAALSSDADIALINLGRFNDQRLVHFDRMLRGYVWPIDYDNWGAISMHHIKPNIPANPGDFVHWASSFPWQSVALHESGLYNSPDLKLCALALTTVMASARSRTANWERVRTAHTNAYIAASPKRVAQKIAERLNLTGAADEILPPKFRAARISRFGLPKQFSDYHDPLEAWVGINQASLQGRPGYQLYQEVKQRVT